jgi:hypothetical protein
LPHPSTLQITASRHVSNLAADVVAILDAAHASLPAGAQDGASHVLAHA